ncbi:MAG: NAD(+)/NADH kinase [Chloroflexi bacterium]|nr:NAD(+)/NADH kinase [Chloroflexota bacterium]
MFKRIGIIYKSGVPAAEQLARALAERLRATGRHAWLAQVDHAAPDAKQVDDTDLLVTVGGDGTILRTARLTVPRNIPILGVNMGNLGFMTEVASGDALTLVPRYLDTEGWIEERSLLDVEVVRDGRASPLGEHSWSLNEVMVGRRTAGRMLDIEARIDRVTLTSYKADGVIVATATGSTAYALAAGGPVLHPENKGLLLLPVSPHLSLRNPIVLHPDAVVELVVGEQSDVVASLDGQVDYPLRPRELVRAKRSARVARFFRVQPHTYFYATLTRRLSMGGAK